MIPINGICGGVEANKTAGKIVAIGGGENGRINSKGEKLPYELSETDHKIIKLTNMV